MGAGGNQIEVLPNELDRPLHSRALENLVFLLGELDSDVIPENGMDGNTVAVHF
jgi:hypothetical protein